MKIPAVTFIFLVIFSCSSAASADGQADFIKCLTQKVNNYSSISSVVYTPSNSSFTTVLQFPIWNLRFRSNSTPTPQVIITPDFESQIPPVVLCSKASNLELRTRSGTHDYEGISSYSSVPFVILDLINFSEVTVDVAAKTAWIEAGASLGVVYYRIAEKSPTLGFPAGLCPLVGAGGHISGGGYGTMLRKYGLAADNVIDARIVDVKGRILDRKSMGENLFWAIRGGGGASFGVITKWKVRLVDVPENVTVFRVYRTLEQNLTQILHKWQTVAPTIDNNLYIGTLGGRANNTISLSFFALYLGGADTLQPLMEENFPELGLVSGDYIETSWILSTLFFAGVPMELEDLLNRTQPLIYYMKVKADYVVTPIPESGIDGIWSLYNESAAEQAILYMVPYGGRMNEICESALPFPHRAGTLFMIAHFVIWQDAQDSNSSIDWARRVSSYMTPYVSKNPRAAYINYRDLDIGVNNAQGKTSYAQASVWGKRYFKNNFNRLVGVKTIVDPKNFFRQEQTIPPMQLIMGMRSNSLEG